MSKVNLTISPKLVQQQRLILTQELQLFLKLIQMNTLELKDYLEEQLIENPTLEESQEKETDENEDTIDESDLIGLDYQSNSSSNDNYPHSREFFSDIEDENPWENRVSKPESLYDYLRWQLEVSEFSNEDRDIATIIIGNINEDGYLETSVDEIALSYVESKLKTDLPPDETVESLNEYLRNFLEANPKYLDDVNRVLKTVQTSFDPLGIGSPSLVECLKIQVFEMGYDKNSQLIKVIENHLEDISNNDYKNIAKSLGIDIEEVEEIVEIIINLEPKPGRPFYIKDIEKYIVPDFYLYKVGNEFQIQFNKNFPRVRISSYYRNLIRNQNKLSAEAKKYLKEKIEAAKRILKCLEEREAAVRKVIERITEVQKDFFEHGREYLKPLRLKDIAESVGVHESTVSRITSNRYIQTPAGVIELKSLFSRGVDTSSGKQVSLEKVKAMLKEIISNESTQNPFSDEDLAKILERRNVKVARRTVAKYRTILNIPSSSKRMKKGGKS